MVLKSTSRFRSLLAMVLSIGAITVAGQAAAQDNADVPTEVPSNTPSAASVSESVEADEAEQDRVAAEERRRNRLKRVTITINPVALLFWQTGATLEYMVARHHGFRWNWYLSTTEAAVDSRSGDFGYEAGYRFYTGKLGAEGFFFGPSILLRPGKVKLTTYGIAMDGGVQAILGSGITAGAAIGMEFTRTPGLEDRYGTQNHVSGRLLLALGYSF